MGIIGNITGKTTQDKVAEYSEKYGQVLLGMHADIMKFDKKINAFDLTAKEIDSIISSIANINDVASSLTQSRDNLQSTASEVKNSVARIREANKDLSDHITSALVKNDEKLQRISAEIIELTHNISISIEQSNIKHQDSIDSLAEIIRDMQMQNNMLFKRINILIFTLVVLTIGGLAWKAMS